MRIAIMGSGGIGGYVGAHLAKSGEDVSFIARGAHLAALKTNGIRVHSPAGELHMAEVNVTENPAEIGVVDIVLFTVKLWDTEAAAASLKPIVGPATRVVTLQNGIDSADMIARHLPRDRIVAGAIYMSAYIAAPGVIRHPGGTQRMVIDRFNGDPAVAAFHDTVVRSGGAAGELTGDIATVLWEKFVRLTTFSASTGLMRTTIGPILADANARAFVVALLEEALAVAAAEGHRLPAGFRDESLALYATFPPETRASMAEDLLHGRRLELPWLSARIHALGEKHGIPTPSHTAAFRALSLYVNGTPA